jgi:hypothetical protein
MEHGIRGIRRKEGEGVGTRRGMGMRIWNEEKIYIITNLK